MTSNDPLWQEKRPGFSFVVWSNRIEVQDGLFSFTAKKMALLLRSVTDVSVVGLTRKLQVTMQDGKTHQFVLSKPDDARSTILSAL